MDGSSLVSSTSKKSNEKGKNSFNGVPVWQFSAKKGGHKKKQKRSEALSPLLSKFSQSYAQESFETEKNDEEDEDDKSVQFSIDPEMLQKLNIRKLVGYLKHYCTN